MRLPLPHARSDVPGQRHGIVRRKRHRFLKGRREQVDGHFLDVKPIAGHASCARADAVGSDVPRHANDWSIRTLGVHIHHVFVSVVTLEIQQLGCKAMPIAPRIVVPVVPWPMYA